MPSTLIVECPNCGGLLMAASDKKTRTCPYCTKRISLHKAKRVAAAQNVFEASNMLRILKSQRQTKKKPQKKDYLERL
ncbi:MAG: DUF1922 domain-containing protein [Candidatus Bathyarchaeota archaeon]|nr:DUF1922 domain-containing protein [Candidatus Bathyarchaeota archaeon]